MVGMIVTTVTEKLKGAAWTKFPSSSMTNLLSEYIFSLSQSPFLQSLAPVGMK